MDSNLSLTGMLATLEAQLAHYREQEAFHAGQEAFHAAQAVFHRERRAAAAAELEPLARCLEALRATVTAAADLAARGLPNVPAPAEPPAVDDLLGRRRLSLAKVVERIVERKAPDERFGPKSIAAEINETLGARLGRTVDERQVSVSLRWLARDRRIVLLQRGRPAWEAQYARQA
ncbi:MAG TPA: hypothetical protein VGH73_08560 [Thermoanaerobaculia bacterium]|jgi:hypothetical protein